MPSTHDAVPCDGCQQLILWAFTEAGRRQAVNADPDPKGNAACSRDGTGRIRSRGLSKDRPTLEHAEWLAMPHRATCPSPPAPRPSAAPRRIGSYPRYPRQPW